MRRSLPLLLAIVLAVSAGCGPSVVPFGGKPRIKQYNKVVSLSPSSTELLIQTQAMMGSRFAGRTAADNWPKGQVEQVPIVATVKPDYEKIASIKPDLICYDADLYNEADIKKISELGADRFVIDATTIDAFIKELYSLGALVGGETYMSDYVDKIIQARSASSALSVHPTVAVVMPGSGGQDMIAGTDSFVADVVKAAGGTPVGPKGTKFVPMDPESFFVLNPEWIVTSGDAQPLLADPKFKTMKAIVGKRLIPVKGDVLLRRGTRVDVLITGIFDKLANPSK